MILKILGAIKGRSIILDDKVDTIYLLSFLLDKLICLIRGILKTRKFIYIGCLSKIRGVSHLHVSKGVEIGRFCEIDCLSQKGLFIGKGSKIGSFSIVKVSGSLRDLGTQIIIGDNVGIGEFAHIGGAGGVKIGKDTISGSYLSIHPENHVFFNDGLIREQGVTRQGVKIGSNCWLGAKVTFLDGSEVGNGCVVAAGSIVTKKFGDNVVIGGVPAKVLKSRVG